MKLKSEVLEKILNNRLYACNIACWHRKIQKHWFNIFWFQRYQFWLSGFSSMIVESYQDIEMKINGVSYD